ncbi:outer membrane protein assembly factor BamB family protein [Rubinisphaera brasiliensis]|uniref:Pyrrolo-quinoline quinone repeat domain-containing protein n=1 Tax=Rubinisphaera brasiliensis (strain ATCC 49424 / DSM 5305 / JCM 21570 / IAM 15109 / NBRC 103401 / IFAM 1448) TaxID=756272 RepID=F0SFD4_RUBBR|nr:PQQ-binding-like beta-propeller repeat protein [Rubinisphaera brasiliensis]ADY59341.1 hypothetical protein Plabr_1730 [Rubinisphaera brasiliensis DSM 5305]
MLSQSRKNVLHRSHILISATIAMLNVFAAHAFANDEISNPPEPVWSASIGRDAGTLSAAVSYLFVGTTSENGPDAELRCYDQMTGTPQWIYRSPRLSKTWLDQPRNAIRSRPAVTQSRTVLYTNRAELICLELDEVPNDQTPEQIFGKDDEDICWRFDLRSRLDVFKRDAAAYGMPPNDPLIHKGLLICATGNASTLGLERYYDGKTGVVSPKAPACIAVDLQSGDLVWENNDASPNLIYSANASPLLVSSRNGNNELLVFVGGDGKLYGISVDSGRTLWESCEAATIVSPRQPVDCGEFVIISGRMPLPAPKEESTTVLWGFSKDTLLSGGDHKQPDWTCAAPEYHGAITRGVYHNGALFVLCENGILICVDVSSGKILNKRRIPSAGFSFSDITICKDHLLIPAEEKLYFVSADTQMAVRKVYDWNFTQEARLTNTSRHLFVAGNGQLHCYAIEDFFK